jgi:nucleotide-binding universal stress UspA family protein
MLNQAIEPMLQHQGPTIETLRCLLYYCGSLAGTGRCRQALAEIERAQQWVNKNDLPTYQANFLLICAVTCLLMHDWPKALHFAERLLEHGKRTSEGMYAFGALDAMAWPQSHLSFHQQALDNRARAAELGVAFEGKFGRTDSVDDAIVKAAAEHGCDLIVMVTHGRGAFGELLFGSHTKNVLSRSKVPLLVLH